MNARLLAPALSLLALACADTPAPKPRPTLTREELMDPRTCESCHPTHYREWKASMHAYASEDPVFVAMNELGQQETDGGMGDFCVQCHAPMAVREDATTDGRNLDELPDHLKGVTCYFCHNIESIEGDHNAQLTLANDTTMRGGLEDPVRPSAHRVAFSRFLDSKSPDSSRMCGACHDIVNDHGVHLERTFAEYEASIFGAYDKPSFASCIGCHMDSRTDLAAVDAESDVGLRSVHSHLFAGVDVALTSWPDREIYEEAVECELEDSAFFFEQGLPLFDAEDNTLTLEIDTNAGHNMPSGSSQDRRLWVELTGFGPNGEELCTTGAVPDDVAVVGFRDPIDCKAVSPGVVAFRDRIFDADGNETHMFWRAAPSDEYPEGFSNLTLMPQQRDGTPHTQMVNFVLSTFNGALPDRLRIRLRIRAMDHDVLDELIEHDLLDPAVAEEIPTFSIIGGEREMQLVDGLYEWLPPPPRERDCRIETICNWAPDAIECSQ